MITSTTRGPLWHRIEMPRCLDATAVRTNAALWERVAGSPRNCLLEVSGIEFIDTAGLGIIISLHRRLMAAGWHLVLIAPSRALRKVIAQMHLQHTLFLAEDGIGARDLIRARWPIARPEGAS